MEQWREQLIKDNYPALVYFTITKYGQWKDDEEFAVAETELVNAALRFNENSGVKFSTYAVKCMRLRIKKFNMSKRHIISNRVITNGVVKYKYADALGFDTQIQIGKDNTQTIGDLLEQQEGVNERLIIEKVNLSQFISKLSQREQTILSLRAQDISQEEIGKIIGITQVQVSRILKKLKNLYLKGE